MAKYEGNCFVCGKVQGRTALKNHVLKEHNEGNEKCYLVRAESRYQGSPFWLFFTVPMNAKLADIDDFLRQIWLECCGHSSVFKDTWTEYPKTTRLHHFDIGDTLAYKYDFGTSTDLLITFSEEISRSKQKEKIQLLARNMPVEVKCLTCSNLAKYVDVNTWGQEKFACQWCYQNDTDEASYYLPITNSPRSGHCGYGGDHDIWTLDPRGAFPQPFEKSTSGIPKPQPDNVVQFRTLNENKAVRPITANGSVYEFNDDEFKALSHHEIDLTEVLTPIEEIKARGELDLYLESCEHYEMIPAYVLAMAFQDDPDVIADLSQFLDFTVEQLNKLTAEEKEGYDVSAIYETHAKLIKVLNHEYDPDTDDDMQVDLPTIEQIKSEGGLDRFLETCANFQPLPEKALLSLVEAGHIKMTEITCEAVLFTIKQLEKLTSKEKAGYDFTNLYTAYEKLTEALNKIATVLPEQVGLEKMMMPQKDQPLIKAAKNIINLFGESTHPTVQEKWNKLPDDFKERILNNVYCIKCGVSKIKNYTIQQESIGIVLCGQCAECDNQVFRVIEEVHPPSHS